MKSVPGIEELLEHPSRVADLPVEAARDLLVRTAALQAALSVRILPVTAAEGSYDQHGDRFLDAEHVGSMIGKSKSWVEHNVEQLPEPRRVGGERRWSEREMRRWMQTCPAWSEQ
jgi:predicted DNA-binding transcriptional regulator AlpA